MHTEELLVALHRLLDEPGLLLRVVLDDAGEDPWEAGADRVITVHLGVPDSDGCHALTLIDQRADEPGILIRQSASGRWQSGWQLTLGERRVSDWR